MHNWKNNTQVDNAKSIDAVMRMFKLLGYSDDYSKTSGGFLQYCRDEPALDNTGDNTGLVNSLDT